MLPPAWLHHPAEVSTGSDRMSCQLSSCCFQQVLFTPHFETQKRGLGIRPWGIAEEWGWGLQSQAEQRTPSCTAAPWHCPSCPMGQELNLPLGARDPRASNPPVQRELLKSQAKARPPEGERSQSRESGAPRICQSWRGRIQHPSAAGAGWWERLPWLPLAR